MKSISSRFLPGWVVVAAAASFPSMVFSANIWDGGGGDGNWNTVANWDTDTVPAFPVGINFAGTAGLSSTNDLTGIQVNGITFDANAGAFVVSGNAITLGGNILNNSTSLQTINTGLILSAARTVNAPSGDVTLGGPVTGSFALVKTGPGKLTLSGTGGTSQLAIGSDAAGGTVELSGGAWSQAGTLTSLGLSVGAGATASGTLIVSGGTHTFGGDDYSNAARVGTALAASQTSTGSFTITGGLVRIGTASSTNAALNVGTTISGGGISNGTLNVSGGELQVGSRILIGANNTANTASLTLSGTGVINMTRTGATDPGQLRLGSGATTLNFNGGTFIGTSVNQATATATSSIYYNGTEFRVNAAGSIIGGGGTAINQVKSGGLIIDTNGFNSNVDRALANFTGVNGNLTKKGLGTLSLTAANTITGTATVEGGTLAFSGSGTLGANSAVVVGTGAVLSFNRSDTFGNHATNVSQTITANGGTITNGNTFTTLGTVNLNGAVLTSTGGANAQFPAFSLRGNVNVGGSTASTISSSGTNSGMLVGQNAAGTQTTFNVANATGSAASDLNVSATLRDNMNAGFTSVATGIRKTGVGTMALSGTNTYTGTTSVDQGTLAITGNGSIAASTTINVASGAFLDVSATTTTWSLASGQTLRGNGTVVGNANIVGTLSAGNSTGSLVFTNDLALLGSSVFEVDAGAVTSDLVTAGNLAFGGSLSVQNLNGTLAEGQAFNLFDFTSATGTFNSVDLPTLDNGLTWDISGLYNQGVITVVPEPSIALLLPVLGGVVLCTRRSRSHLA